MIGVNVANLLRDVLFDLVSLGRDAKAEAGSEVGESTTSESRAFQDGRRAALYEAVALIVSRAGAFGLSRQELGLPDDLDLEAEML